MPKNDPATNLSTAYLARLLGVRVTSIEPIDGGNNSRVFKVTAADNSMYAAKLYLGLTADGQSRMGVEFNALEFLRKRGVECVPRPVAADHSRQCAVYEFVEGASVDSTEATTADIDQAVRFLRRLNALKDDPESLRLPKAAEACFSFRAIVNNLKARLGQLQEIDGSPPRKGGLDKFLDKEFLPAFRRIVAWCQKRIIDAGTSMDAELNPEDLTLSPSDFGFHNSLRRSNGELVFLDFEYFGWDDPAKIICDFLLHPAMELNPFLKRRFVENLIGTPSPDHVLLDRVETAYPLFGLKWCLILLNPFLSEYRLQRGIASTTGPKRTSLFEQQLEKTKLFLSIVERDYESFPYWNVCYAPNVN